MQPWIACFGQAHQSCTLMFVAIYLKFVAIYLSSEALTDDAASRIVAFGEGPARLEVAPGLLHP